MGNHPFYETFSPIISPWNAKNPAASENDPDAAGLLTPAPPTKRDAMPSATRQP
jgi:hypothetical protein